jgi:uncharacterized membrane protein
VWYVVMFAGLAVLLVVVVLVRNARTHASGSRLEAPTGTAPRTAVPPERSASGAAHSPATRVASDTDIGPT